ncbi:MAG: SDR family NAD(P)-dependent oxidoreductase, partial [Pseudomonadota bacterium]
MSFQNKVVWITGASSGIGAALAKALAADGPKFVLSARRQDALEAVAQDLTAKGVPADDIFVLPFDILDEGARASATDAVMDRFGRIDLLVNNAGRSQRSLALDTDMQTYRDLFELDVFAQIDLTKRVLPIMIAQKSGHIAITSSVAGKIGAQLRTGYCAAKHAMQGFFDALRAEVASEGIHVTSILPGFVQTEISKNAMRGDGTAFGVVTESIEGGMDVDAAAAVMAKGLR